MPYLNDPSVRFTDWNPGVNSVPLLSVTFELLSLLDCLPMMNVGLSPGLVIGILSYGRGCLGGLPKWRLVWVGGDSRDSAESACR